MTGSAFLIDNSKDPPVKSLNPAYADLLAKLPKAFNDKGKYEFSIILLRTYYQKKISKIILRKFYLTGKQVLHHYLAQYCAMFIIQMNTAGRGIERMESYKKSDFEIKVDEDTGEQYWKLVVGGETKNHKTTDQDMSKGGRIYFRTNNAGLNQGEYIRDFLTKLNPENRHFFQKPQRPKDKSKDAFKLHENPECW